MREIQRMDGWLSIVYLYATLSTSVSIALRKNLGQWLWFQTVKILRHICGLPKGSRRNHGL